MTNKLVYISAHFKPVGKYVTVQVPTGETKKGFFGGEKAVYAEEKQWQQTGWSDCLVDGHRLSQDIAQAVDSLNRDGFEVVSVTPIMSGAYFYQYNAQGITSSPRILRDTEKVSGGGSYGFGYGFSFTEGVTLIAKKVA